jgi:threonine synthase
MLDTPYTFAYSPALTPAAHGGGDGMWRWSSLLPLDGSDYPLQVGRTPLLRPRGLRTQLGLPGLVIKDETRTPTGSNKDRATALCAVDAVRHGARAMCAASSGNVAVSLSAGGAAVGLPTYVFVSARSVSPAKVELMRSFGATVVLVDDTYERAYALSEQAAAEFGWYSRNTGSNPLCLQAKKTVAFEAWEQLGGRLPDVAYLPIGDGVTLAAFVHGCDELIACGVAECLPTIIGVQAHGAAPLAEAFATSLDTWTARTTDTFADGIDVGDPFFGAQALAGVRRSGGTIITVTDDEMRSAIAVLATRAGLLSEPAGVASLAGAIKDAPRMSDRDATVLVLVSGTGLKDQRWLPRGGGRQIESPSSLDGLARALGSIA